MATLTHSTATLISDRFNQYNGEARAKRIIAAHLAEHPARITKDDVEVTWTGPYTGTAHAGGIDFTWSVETRSFVLWTL